MNVGTKSNRSSRFLIGGALLVLAALLAACEFPFGKDCALARPFDISPTFGEVVGTLTPTIYWDYDGLCAPDGFEISLGTSHLRTEDDITETVDARTGSWTPPGPLEPATFYRVRVRAVRGSMDGPVGFSGFRTGPVCAVGVPSAYPAPTLLSPEDGAVITEAATYSPAPGEEWTTPLLDFAWEGESGCVTPNGYLLQVSRFASFTPAWATTELRSYEDIAWHEFAPGEEWHDCQRYYWRVTPWLGDELFGPNSETWSFVINTSGALCPLELAEPIIEHEGPGIPFSVSGHAAIAGHVWHDECAVPWESTDVAPPGCVIMPDGGMEANGLLDSGESGIEGVTVLLDDQPCPGTDGWSEETDASGYYSFHNLTAGTYCIEINAASDGNEDVLIPGSWTVPYRWYGPGPVSAEVFLGSDDDISRMNDFAWDYQFLPAPTPEGPEAFKACVI